MSSGRLFNLQRFSLQDGPGLRSTVFLKGCPLECGWCHNPESRSADAQIIRFRNRCMACGLCNDEELKALACADLADERLADCPTGALQKVGWTSSPEALAESLLLDRIFFEDSGGGVTFSGGEPLLQASFIIETMDLLRKEGVHLALDTCGFAPWEDLRNAAARADLVLYDLKLMDDSRHREATGVSNAPILENLKALSEIHRAIWIRVPIIPGINDDEANLDAIAAFLAPLAGIRKVELLPYHAAGEAKFPRIGLTSPRIPSPNRQRMEELVAHFSIKGLDTTIGGRP